MLNTINMFYLFFFFRINSLIFIVIISRKKIFSREKISHHFGLHLDLQPDLLTNTHALTHKATVEQIILVGKNGDNFIISLTFVCAKS